MKYLMIALRAYLFAVLPTASMAVTVAPPAPELSAPSYLVMEAETGAYLVEKNMDRKVEPASLTKMMTTYVAASQLAEGQVALADPVMVSERAWRMGGSRMFIEVGQQVSVEDLLKGVIIQSGNDASIALAEHLSGSEEEFARLMNRYAEEMGLENTNFVNSSGWPDANHYTTARDLAVVARRLAVDYPEIYALHAVREFTWNDIKQSNRNSLLWQDDTVDGVKTGYTEDAGYCLVASARRDGMRLISVVMGAQDVAARTSQTRALLNYAFRVFEKKKLYAAGEVVTTVKLWKGKQDSLDLAVKDDLTLVLPKVYYQALQPQFDIPAELVAPIQAGAQLGELALRLDEKLIASLPLVAPRAAAQGSFFVRLRDHVKLSRQD